MKHEKRVHMIWIYFIMICAAGVCSAFGFLLWDAILSETSPALIAALSGAAGFATLSGAILLIGLFGRKRRRDDYHSEHSNILDAIDQISRGNFNVLIESNPHIPHNDIAEAFNKMARDLGSLENMRQDFISNVSHEIQSPLTSISGFAELLKACDEKDRLHYVEIIKSESKRLSSLSDNLLKLSKLETTELERREFRLDKQIQHVILTAEPQWSAKSINIDVDLEKTIYNGDEDLLAQVWINLLHNAIKFTPEGGEIQFAIDNKRLIIRDTGVGISAEDLPHIFERFYKADKARDRSLGGNGLGLSLVKKIVELHGGNVTVESKIGKGTTFTVNLHSV